MYNDELSEENIKREIDRLGERIKALLDLTEKIKNVKFYECGIRRSDHKICYFSFSLVGQDAWVDVKIPQTNETYRTSLDIFKSDFVPYSEKVRAVLPKRSKK